MQVEMNADPSKRTKALMKGLSSHGFHSVGKRSVHDPENTSHRRIEGELVVKELWNRIMYSELAIWG